MIFRSLGTLFLSIVFFSRFAYAEDVILYGKVCTPRSLAAIQTIMERNVAEILKSDNALTNVRVTVRSRQIPPVKESIALSKLVEGLEFFIDKSPSANYSVKINGQAPNLSCTTKVKFITTVYAVKTDSKERFSTRSESLIDVAGVVLLRRVD